jgi:MFS family permease
VRPEGLWRHADFLKLWGGQTVSVFGTLIGRFAFLLVAAITLEATPFQMSILRVADMAPGLLVGLLAGVWVDRLSRRAIMIWTDLGRFLLVLSVPVAALLGVLAIEYLYAVALLVGVLATFFEIAYRAYLPWLVERDQLVEGNAKLQASSSVAEVGGFGLAGALVQLLTAPIAMVVDALSFLVSAISLALIRRPEPPPAPIEERQTTWHEIREGFEIVFRDPVLRAFAGSGATHQLFVQMWVAVLILFLTREMGLSPLEMGLVFAVGGVSSLIGAAVAAPLTSRFGLGRTVIWAHLLFNLSIVFTPLSGGPYWLVLLLVSANQFFDGAYIVYEINETSLIQAISPERSLGRVNASLRFLGWAMMLLGSVIGGVLGEVIGVRWTMLFGALMALTSVVWLLASPIRGMKTMPEAQTA